MGYLKIGTLHRIKSENILYDHGLQVFTRISHPPLLNLDPGGEITGLLASRFSVSTDYRIWTFFLRDDYVWSDGIPVTSKDVKFSLEYLSRHVPSRGWLQKSLLAVKIKSDYILEMVFNKPYTRLDIELTSFPIIPRHIWQRIPNPRLYSGSTQYTGCGPLIISNLDLNSGILLLQRNSYWRGRQPVIKGVEIHTFQNLDVLTMSLERGSLDTYYNYAGTYPYFYLSRLKATGRFNFLEKATRGLVFLGFNLENGPTVNPRLRKAIRFALDYQEILNLINLGYGELPRRGFLPPASGIQPETALNVLDRKEAEKLLQQAGYRDIDRDGLVENARGENLYLSLLSTPPYTRLCTLIKSYLSQVGIGIKVNIVDNGTWISLKDKKEYQITITRTTPWGMLMHAGWGTGYFDARRTGEGVLQSIADPEFLLICDAILATRNRNQLRQYAARLERYYAINLPAIALIWPIKVIPFNRNFTGWYHDSVYGIINPTNFVNLTMNSDHE